MNKKSKLYLMIERIIKEEKTAPVLFKSKLDQKEFTELYTRHPNLCANILKIKELLQNENLFGQIQMMSFDAIQIEPKTPTHGKYDGMQIIFDFKTEQYEVSEYQAGPDENELHIFTDTKNYKEAIKSLLLGNKNRTPIRIYK